ARARRGHVHARRGGGDHEVVVHVIKAQESALRTIRPLGAIGDLTPQHFGVETERALKDRDQQPNVSYASNLDTHMPYPPYTVALSPCQSGLLLQERPDTYLGHTHY